MATLMDFARVIKCDDISHLIVHERIEWAHHPIFRVDVKCLREVAGYLFMRVDVKCVREVTGYLYLLKTSSKMKVVLILYK